MWPSRQETADLVAFTEETLSEKLHFLCSYKGLYNIITLQSGFKKVLDLVFFPAETFHESLGTTGIIYAGILPTVMYFLQAS